MLIGLYSFTIFVSAAAAVAVVVVVAAAAAAANVVAVVGIVCGVLVGRLVGAVGAPRLGLGGAVRPSEPIRGQLAGAAQT